MNTTWLIYYGHRLGMSREETMNTRIGEMFDLLSCMGVENGALEVVNKKRWDIFEALALR